MTTTGPVVVPASPDDLDAVVALVNGAYRGEGAARGWTTEAGVMAGQRVDRAMLEADLARAGDAVLLTLRDAGGDLLGCVWVEMVDEGLGYLGMLTVRPDLQAGGFGRMLLEGGEAWARGRGASRMRMTVVQVRDTLIAWYERRGYRRTGQTEPFPYEDRRFGEPLRDGLHFVVLERAL